MRIISLITAIAVVAILYVLVFERDVLQDFSKGKKIEEIAEKFSYQNNHLDYVLGHYKEKNKDLEKPSKNNVSELEDYGEISEEKLDELFDGLDLLSESGIGQAIQHFNNSPPPRRREIFWKSLFDRIPINKANQFLELMILHY